jgi:hypothetical protein
MKNLRIAGSIIFGITCGVCLGLAIRNALASRDSNGNFTLYTPGNPVQTRTIISSSWANNTLNDIATEITSSITRDGGILSIGPTGAPSQMWTGSGFQNSARRVITRGTAGAPPDCAGGTLNLTVAQFLENGIATCGSTQTINFPTWQGPSGIVQALPGVPTVGDLVSIIIQPSAPFFITIGFGTGGTNASSITQIGGGNGRTLTCRITSVTLNAETATCYGM